MQNCCAIMHSMKKAVKETPYAESDKIGKRRVGKEC